jgi:hypothetical protein
MSAWVAAWLGGSAWLGAAAGWGASEARASLWARAGAAKHIRTKKPTAQNGLLREKCPNITITPRRDSGPVGEVPRER